MKIAVAGETSQGLRDHKGPEEQSAVRHQRMIPQRLQEMSVQQTDKGSGAAASGAVESKVGVQHTGRQRKLWQEHIVKQCPCHKTYPQKNTSQIK